MTPGTGYAAAGPVVLRAALVPRTGRYETDTREPDDPARLCELIRIFRDDPALAAALELASPDLASALTSPRMDSPKHRRRMTLALTGYLLRARHRATPFGLWAGTALIHRAPAGAGGVGTRHRVLLRPSPRWLAGLVAGLEGDPGVTAGLRVAAAPSLRRAGASQVLVDTRTGGPGQWRAEKIVRRSRLLDAVTAIARDGTGYTALAGLLRAAAPALGEDELAAYVTRLLSERLLVSDLLPEPGETDPLGAVIDLIPGHPLVRGLSTLRREFLRERAAPTAADVRRLRARMRSVRAADADLVADAVAGTDLVLPGQVAAEVARAASVAWACVPAPVCRPLADLHLAMLNRYGLGRPVPLGDLLDPAESLGLRTAAVPGTATAGTGAAGTGGAGTATRGARDLLLAGLAAHALAAGRAEVVVGPDLQHRLSALVPDRGPLPAADVMTEVITTSAQALNDGDFLVSVGSGAVPGPAGSCVGRLAGYLGPEAALLAARDPFDAARDPLDVEVVFRPPDPAAANLVRETGWTEYRIDLTRPASRHDVRDLPLSDLSVIVTREGLRLRSRRLERDIRPVSFSALDPRHAGAIAGLLLDLGRHGRPQWRPWDWGAAGALPWLPRVRTGRTILAPARWLVPPHLLHLAAAGSEREWRSGLLAWRDASELPDVIVAGTGDRRMPLDLADPVHGALLRRECRAADVVVVTEPPGGVTAWRAANWPTGPGGPHAAEFIIPLRTRGESRPSSIPASAAVSVARGAPAVSAAPIAASVYLPGDTWLCASLTVPACLQEPALSELTHQDFRAAMDSAGVDRWFFVRTAAPDGQPALGFRFHGPPGGLNQTLLPALNAWCTRLRASGLIGDLSLVSYRPELWRYGGSACIESAERFFCADSWLCLESAAAPGTVRAEQLAAPGVARILTVMLGSAQAVGELPHPRLSPAQRRLFTRLRPSVRGLDGGAGRSARQDWDVALAAYKTRLADSGQDPGAVALSLVHMHCNRLAGPDDPAERVAVALARDLVLTRSAGSVTHR